MIDAVLRRGLMKKPETRYNSCSDFVNGLETACNNTQGWKNLPRGGGLSMPTVVSEAPTRAAAFTSGMTTQDTVMERGNKASRWVLPFVAALVVALGLFGLIALQFGPGLGMGHTSAPAADPPASSQPVASSAPSNPTPVSNPPANVPAPVTPEEKKPSPMTPQASPPKEPPATPAQTATADSSGQKPPQLPEEPTETPTQDEERPQLKPRPANGPQDVLVTSEPAGATAILDSNPAASCKTPCVLTVMPGRHTLALNLDGYHRESREIRITDSPVEVPMVTLRVHAGTLMLTSAPGGAVIYLNDKLIPQTTPTQLSLAPGTYNVRVERNGIRKSESVEIRNGETSYIKIPLQ